MDDGTECGQTYQKSCVKSWHEMGARVIAVNVSDELAWAQKAFPGVDLIPAPLDSREQTGGRPLPFIHDLVRAASIHSEGPYCGLINSDIYLKGMKEHWPAIEQALNGGMVLFRRMEMDWPSFETFKFYPFGFDVFLMDKRIGPILADAPFAVGIPWWDFWLPLMAFLKGFNLYRVEPAIAFHLAHQTRWDTDQFVEYGAKLFEMVEQEAHQAVKSSELRARGEFVLNGFQLVREASDCDLRDAKFSSGLSHYLKWFFDKSAAVSALPA